MKYIEEKTEKILKELNITRLPIDPKECANKLGVKVQSLPLQADVSGLFVIKDNVAHIMYNEAEAEQRIRFTIAHELGHFILHKEISLFIDKSGKVLYRNSESTTGEVLREREANAFAASLLMPQSFIDNEVKKIPKGKEIIDYLAEKFNVSSLAMTFRLSNLGFEIGL